MQIKNKFIKLRINEKIINLYKCANLPIEDNDDDVDDKDDFLPDR